MTDPRRSLAHLTRTERRALIVSAAEARDSRQAAGDVRLAAVWADLAALAAEVEAEQDATLRRLEADVLGLTDG
jgi:hypothetical protein